MTFETPTAAGLKVAGAVATIIRPPTGQNPGPVQVQQSGKTMPTPSAMSSVGSGYWNDAARVGTFTG